MFDLNAMAVFVQVVKSGSFSAAAIDLSMPLSTVSRKVSDLEMSLQVKLLERSTRSLRMTEVGEIYFDQCRRGIETFKLAEILVEKRQSIVSGTVRISLPPSLADPLFVPIIGLFQIRYPNANVAVYSSERNIDRVEEGVDLSFRVGPVADTSLISRRLLRYRHMLVTSPKYLATVDLPSSPSDLMGHRLIAFGFWREQRKCWILSRNKKQKTVTFEPNLSFNDYAAIHRSVVLGQGIAEIPSILCNEALRDKSMIELLPAWRFQNIDLQALHTGTKNMSRPARLFLETCSEQIMGL